MTVLELCDALSLTPISLPQGDRSFDGVYIGDLLSWVMGKAQSDQLWITIMSNINIVAVAALTDVAAILLAEGVTLDEKVVSTAGEKGINVLASDLSAYELAMAVAGIDK